MNTPLNDTEVIDLISITQEKGLFIRYDEADNFFSSLNKVNFVDSNNRLVGFDLKQRCCEKTDWYIELSNGNNTTIINNESEYIQISSNEVKNEAGNVCTEVISKYLFCPNVYFDDKTYAVEENEGEYGADVDNIATWGLVNDKGEYVGKIVLKNKHNGYYFHGFYYVKNGQKITYDII